MVVNKHDYIDYFDQIENTKYVKSIESIFQLNHCYITMLASGTSPRSPP